MGLLTQAAGMAYRSWREGRLSLSPRRWLVDVRHLRGRLAHSSPASVGGQASASAFRSRFGGLWTDLPNAKVVVDGKRALGWISADEAELLTRWIDDGFVILPNAVSADVIDALDAEVERIWNGTSQVRAYVEFWQDAVHRSEPAGPAFRDRPVKLLDLIAHLESARQVAFAPAILRFLTLVFERPALAFQSLYFRWGSRQDIHQDTAFVTVSSPMELAASWVALEDIQPKSGELEYYVGSHTLDDYLFEGNAKWMPPHSPEYDAYISSLRTRSDAKGLERRRFLARKGDALIWSADLAHGGSQDVVEGITRKSLVTHYCPSNCGPTFEVGDARARRHRISDAAQYTCLTRG